MLSLGVKPSLEITSQFKHMFVQIDDNYNAKIGPYLHQVADFIHEAVS